MINFSGDNDNLPDTSHEYTGAYLKKPDIPENLTICVAWMFEAWTTEFTTINLFQLKYEDGSKNDGLQWANVDLDVHLSATDNKPQISVGIGGILFEVDIERALFPLTWTRVCLSLSTVTWHLRIVVNGELIKERLDIDPELMKKYALPGGLDMVLGHRTYDGLEFTGMVSQVNIFSSTLSTARMVALTDGGGEECGAPGDYVNWDVEDWKLLSRASIQMVEDGGWVMVNGRRVWIREGPCRRESKVTVYTGAFKYHSAATNDNKVSGCMEHCEKVGKGRSPPVRTLEEWDWMKKEVHAITPDIKELPFIWLAATDAEVEGEWKDAYPPHDQLNTSWAWPWTFYPRHNTKGNSHNCLFWFTIRYDPKAWAEELCDSHDVACLKDVS